MVTTRETLGNYTKEHDKPKYTNTITHYITKKDSRIRNKEQSMKQPESKMAIVKSLLINNYFKHKQIKFFYQKTEKPFFSSSRGRGVGLRISPLRRRRRPESESTKCGNPSHGRTGI